MSATPATGARADASASRMGLLVFGLLVIASFAAFFLAQRLKHIPTAVQDLKFDSVFYPRGGGAPRNEPISFEIERPDRVTVKIIDAKGATVATLASGLQLNAYEPITRHWDGRRGSLGHAGALAPAGPYRVVVLLAERKFEVRSPSSLQLIGP